MNLNAIRRLAALAACATLCGCNAFRPGGASRPELRIYTWSDYIAPSVVERFEREHGCRVTIETFDSNETMYERLNSGKAACDIVTPSSYFISKLVREGLVARLDHDKLPNFTKNFDKRFAMFVLDASFDYNVPYIVSITGFLYDRRGIPEGADVGSWAILDNPKLEGKFSLLDDQREVMGGALASLGLSVNSKAPREIQKAAEQAAKWTRHAAKLDSESFKSDVPEGRTVLAQAYLSDATQAIYALTAADAPNKDDIRFALPKEGFVMTFDEMTMSAAAANPDLAHEFINFMYDGDNARENMEFTFAPTPVKPALEALDGSRKAMILSEDALMNGQIISEFDTDAVGELYNKAWDRVKSTKAP